MDELHAVRFIQLSALLSSYQTTYPPHTHIPDMAPIHPLEDVVTSEVQSFLAEYHVFHEDDNFYCFHVEDFTWKT
jgi:hypothetical protein